MGWKSNGKVHFSKQMFLFHLFLPFILRYVKKKYSIFKALFPLYSIYFQFFIFECYNLLIALVLEIIKYTERKKNDLNVTLPSQISSRNSLITIILD